MEARLVAEDFTDGCGLIGFLVFEVVGAARLTYLDLVAMKARGKKLKCTKRKRGPDMSFGELVQTLWQPEAEEFEPRVAMEKQKIPASKRKRVRKS